MVYRKMLYFHGMLNPCKTGYVYGWNLMGIANIPDTSVKLKCVEL